MLLQLHNLVDRQENRQLIASNEEPEQKAREHHAGKGGCSGVSLSKLAKGGRATRR